MRIGLTLPSMLPGVDRTTLLAWCRRIDDGPFASLSMGERITYPNHELWTVLSAAAAVTERVRIISTVVLLPMHDAVMVAKQAATLDVVSDGRFTLGVGVGGREDDYRAVGASFARRHARMDEQVDVMRRIWAGERLDGRAPVGPPPVQPGGPRLLVGAMGPKSIARASHWADGLAGFSLGPDVDECDATFRRCEAEWLAAGRAARPELITSCWIALGPKGRTQLDAYVAGYLGNFGDDVGSSFAALCRMDAAGPLRVAIRGLAAVGCDELILVPTTADLAEIDRIEAVIAALPELEVAGAR